jgi:site-specific recombinase XerD
MKFIEALVDFNKWRSLKVDQRTVDGYDLSLRYFCMFIQNSEIENITLDQVENWLYWFRFLGFDPNTIEKKAIALRKFFGFFKKREYKVIDPELIPVPKKKFEMPRVAKEEDYRKFLEAIPVNSNCYWHIRNRALTTLLWDTGMRIGEALALNTSDLDLRKREVMIKTEKTQGKMPFRKLTWFDDTQKSLSRWLEKREEILGKGLTLEEPEALFVGVKGGYWGQGARGKRFALGAASDMFRKYSNKAGLKQVLNAHSLRHHLGRELAEKGAKDSLISSILGHSSLQSSYRYTVLFGDEVKKEFQRIMSK